MGSHVTIREFEVDDAFDLLDLVKLNADDMNLPGDMAQAKVEGFLRGWMRTDDILVAERYGRIIGFVIAHRGRSFATGRTASLRVVVARGRRGQGIGAQLVDTMVANLGPSIHRIEATPYVPDEGTEIHWWEKRGFELESVKRDGARLLDGTFTNVAVMVRLREGAAA